MGSIERSIEIKAPPERIWEMLALDRLPEWEEGLKEKVEYISEIHDPKDKYRVGASTRTHIKGAGTIDFEITESLENERITYRMLGKRANKTVKTYILEPSEGGTKFTHLMTYEMSGGMLGKSLDRLGKGMLEKENEKSLEKLKGILEK